jgi:uncharacterized protein (TIGR04222 family)
MRGPEFLVLYLAVGGAVLLALGLLRHWAEPETGQKINLSDPYLIAFLRGGRNETLRVATFSLIDRGILTAEGTKIAASNGAFGKAAPGVEQKIVQFFNPSADAIAIFKMNDAGPAMRGYENQLIQAGLLPDDDLKQTRLLRMGIGVFVLLALGLAKLIAALATGHRNVGFLILLMIVFTIGAALIARPRLTALGNDTLLDLRNLFDGLKDRREEIRNGVSPGEFAMMAAVFGTAAIPDAKKLFPQAGSSGCGSGCGSDSGGGGSSCGGGGCGGCGGG